MKITGAVRYQLLPLVLIPLGLLLYNDALMAPFVYDDKGYILQNEAIRSLSSFLDLSGTRYVGFLSFALNYAAGGYTPFDYHLVNVLIHIANSILVFFLVSSMASSPIFRGEFGDGPAKETVLAAAAVASVLFLVHPIQTQAVTYVTQRFTSLATMFYLLAVLSYAKARAAALAQAPGRRWKGALALSLVFTVLAMKTKEISFTIPFAILIYDMVFFRGHDGRRAASMRIPFYFTLLIIPLTILMPEYLSSDAGSVTETLRRLQVQEAAGLPRDVYVYTQFSVIVAYLKMLVFPSGFAIDRNWPLSHSLFEPTTLLSFLLLASVLAVALALLFTERRRAGAHAALFSFGVLWFFNGLIVESFLVPIQDVIFDQRAYLPGVGFFIAAASAIFYLVERVGRAWGRALSPWGAALLVLVLAAPPLSAVTLERNGMWTDEMRLLDEAIEISPGKARLYYARACVHIDRKEFEKAAGDATRALEIAPNLADALHVRGEALQRLGRLEEAVHDFTRAIELSPAEGSRYYNRAVAYDVMGDYARSIADYSKAVVMDPRNLEAVNGRGVAYFNSGDIARAVVDIEKACSMGLDKACANLEKLRQAGAGGAS